MATQGTKVLIIGKYVRTKAKASEFITTTTAEATRSGLFQSRVSIRGFIGGVK